MESKTPTCDCSDFESADPDDSLCFECVCGHAAEEHNRGFFRRCSFAPPEEPEKPKWAKKRKVSRD